MDENAQPETATKLAREGQEAEWYTASYYRWLGSSSRQCHRSTHASGIVSLVSFRILLSSSSDPVPRASHCLPMAFALSRSRSLARQSHRRAMSMSTWGFGDEVAWARRIVEITHQTWFYLWLLIGRFHSGRRRWFELFSAIIAVRSWSLQSQVDYVR